MADRRQANRNWVVADEAGNMYPEIYDGVTLAVLMDIRDELQAIRRRLDCHETLSIPSILRRISANTHKKRRRRKPTAPTGGAT